MRYSATVERQMNPKVEERQWQALTRHKGEGSETFYYGVSTTGIYCRVGCKSRLPRRENVQFFDSWQAAEQAGFRPCKRCNPRSNTGNDPHREAVLLACKMIEEADSRPSLDVLAEAVGLSKFYFQKVFKEAVGISPKEYYEQKRAERVKASLRQSQRITDAVYDSGFQSNSRFYSQAAGHLGMTPTQYRQGASGVKVSYTIRPADLGWVLVAATEIGVCAIELGDNPELLAQRLAVRFPKAEIVTAGPEFENWVARVLSYLEAPKGSLDLPLDIRGTAFQRQVWTALREIPCGSTASYAEVAGRIGSPKAVRAVAQACASNKIAVAIPCHRVVRSNGELGGYRWGVERKKELLRRESSSKYS